MQADLTEAAGTYHFGAGFDVAITRRWSLVVEACYLHTFAEPEARVVLTPTKSDTVLRVSVDGEYASLGFRYRF